MPNETTKPPLSIEKILFVFVTLYTQFDTIAYTGLIDLTLLRSVGRVKTKFSATPLVRRALSIII